MSQARSINLVRPTPNYNNSVLSESQIPRLWEKANTRGVGTIYHNNGQIMHCHHNNVFVFLPTASFGHAFSGLFKVSQNHASLAS